MKSFHSQLLSLEFDHLKNYSSLQSSIRGCICSLIRIQFGVLKESFFSFIIASFIFNITNYEILIQAKY